MNPHTLPIMSLKPIVRITPSRYFSLQSCILREVLAFNGEIPNLLPISPVTRLGSVIHRLLELAAKGLIRDENDIKESWETEVAAVEKVMKTSWLESHLLPLSRSARNYQVKKQQCFFMIRNQADYKYISSGRGSGVVAEGWVETADKKIGGRIDAMRHTNEGIEIIDYKTGDIFETESIKPEYQQQLKLYAALFYSKHGIWPLRLTVVGLNQQEYDVPVNENDCLTILNNARTRLDEVNGLISTAKQASELANPASDNCRYCIFRPACEAYWNNRQDTPDWPRIVEESLKTSRY